MVAGLLAGALLGALDLFTMVRMAARAAALHPDRASAVVRWTALGRMVLVFLALALGAMALSPPAFLCSAAAYVAVRIAGLFVVAKAHPGARSGRGCCGTAHDSSAGSVRRV